MANPNVFTRSADFGSPNYSLGNDNLMGTITPLLLSSVVAPVEGLHFGVVAHRFVYETPNTLTWQIVISGGTVTAINVVLESSLDNVNWVTEDTSTSLTGESRHVTAKKAGYWRVRLVSFTAGTGSPAITAALLF